MYAVLRPRWSDEYYSGQENHPCCWVEQKNLIIHVSEKPDSYSEICYLKKNSVLHTYAVLKSFWSYEQNNQNSQTTFSTQADIESLNNLLRMMQCNENYSMCFS